MQYRLDKFDAAEHDKYQTLVLPQPHASNLSEKHTNIAFIEDKVKYRGEILICSTHKPDIFGLECGATLALATLINAKHTSKFTDEEWIAANVSKDARDQYKHKYGIFIDNVERVVEIPYSGDQGFSESVYTKGEIIKYPTVLHVDMKGIKTAIKHEKNNRI